MVRPTPGDVRGTPAEERLETEATRLVAAHYQIPIAALESKIEKMTTGPGLITGEVAVQIAARTAGSTWGVGPYEAGPVDLSELYDVTKARPEGIQFEEPEEDPGGIPLGAYTSICTNGWVGNNGCLCNPEEDNEHECVPACHNLRYDVLEENPL